MFDLMALAFQADLTRVITFSMDREASMRTYNNLSISEAFHPLSHHANDPAKQDRLAVIQTYHTKVFARFIDRMAKTPEGDGSLLDHSMVLYGSNMSDSNRHNNDPLPSAILGHAHGRIKGGQHLHYAQDSRHSNLLLTLLERTRDPDRVDRRQRRHVVGGLSHDTLRVRRSRVGPARHGRGRRGREVAARGRRGRRSRRRRSPRSKPAATSTARAADGTTALIWAAYNGDAELVERLLAAGADVERARTSSAAFALSEAAIGGYTRRHRGAARGRRRRPMRRTPKARRR